jgi:putative membrane protein
MQEVNTLMGYYGNWWFGMGAFGWLIMILFWGGVIWLIVWILRTNTPPHQQGYPRHEKSAKEILDIRFAKGEISKKEHAEMKKEIT